ncbi:MAG: PAS domain-containing protein [Chromatiales bacterium]|nr:PAS domain-containing protein [Chromatiales bacterium]
MSEREPPADATIERLREQDTNLRTVQRLLGSGFWKMELANGQLHWSEHVFPIYGLPAGGMAPDFESYVAMVHPDDRAEMLANYERFSTTGALNFEFRHRIIKPDGSTVHVRGVAERGQGSQSGWLIGAVQDVTEDRARLTQLQLLETAVSRQSDSLLITEARPVEAPDGPRIIYVNDAFTRHMGYTPEEVIGKTPRILQGRDTDRRELGRIRAALEAGQGIRTELLNYTRTGEEIWLEIDIVPIKDKEGALTHFVAVQRNVTERKQSERALRISDERFRLISQATNDAIWDWDLVAGTVWWSRGTLEILGFDPEVAEPGPESWTGRIHPDDRDRVVGGIQAVIDGSGEAWSDEYRMCRDDGAVITVADRGFVIRDDQGGAVRMLGSVIDISERLRLEESLRQAQKLEAVGQLTGGVAHDFNNLLTVILGNAELLGERLAREPALRDLATTVMAAATRGAELTQRLLAFARRQPLEPRAVDLNRLVAGMESLLRRALSENIEIEFVRAGGLWVAEIDPAQLESALLNLAINARDAMPDGGRLTIETGNAKLDESYAAMEHDITPGQYVMISVTDSGSGMDAETRGRAFDPFFTTKPAGKGSGLGLSMVYGFAKQSHGHVRIYSEPGEGTAVKLYLPRAQGMTIAAQQAADDTMAKGGCEHILVVEDDRLVREHLVAQLRQLGYQVSSAADGQQALDLLKQEADTALLFTDVVMPGGMNGRELAEAARALRPGLKVLFTSGYTENAIIHQGRLDVGVQLLSKPYRRQELAAKVRKVLDGR